MIEEDGEVKCLLCGRPPEKASEPLVSAGTYPSKRKYTKRKGIKEKAGELPQLRTDFLLLQAEYKGYQKAIADLRGAQNG